MTISLRLRNKKKDMSVLTKDEVQSFFDMFHAKMKIYGIIYRDDMGRIRKLLKSWR